MDIQRIIVFIVFSMSIVLLWDAWQKEHEPPAPPVAVHAPSSVPSAVPTLPQAGAPAAPAATPLPAHVPTVHVRTDLFSADISALGGDIDHLALLRFNAPGKQAQPLVLLDHHRSDLYVTQSGFVDSGLPDHKMLYTAPRTHYVLGAGQKQLAVSFDWAANGLQVTKTYTFTRGSYVVGLTYTVRNATQRTVQPVAYFQFLRNSAPPAGNPRFVKTFTGPAYYTGKAKFQTVDFGDIAKGDVALPGSVDNGWIAMLQHYFLGAWLPEGAVARQFYMRQVGPDRYTAGVMVPAGQLAPGAVVTLPMRLYLGPEDPTRLGALAPGLNLTVNYGWLTVIASPLFWVLAFIQKGVGNWGLAIILLTVLIKLVFFPLSAKSYRSMAQMRVLAPKMQRIKEQYGEDRERLHQAMMELYKTEKVNPLGGCLPVVVQIPVFITLYRVLLSSVDLRQAPFVLWIHDLSVPDPYYVLPVVLGLVMLLQTRLNPPPPDPMQAKVMMIMPLAFGVFFLFLPSGLVLYYLVNNLLSIGQQWYITRSLERRKSGHGER
ncbi:MAG: membrane protein insertase YidC [Betaproteobacteria bacterium]|nr:membrane protein insertase YidC [Betaproteobacteria bacterium]